MRLRRLISDGVEVLETKVTATDELLDTLGNTISYDQSILIQTVGSDINLDKNQIRQVLLDAFESQEQKTDFLEMLQDGHQDFAQVTAADPPKIATPESSEDSQGGNLVIILVVIFASVAVLSGCAFLTYRFLSNDSDHDDPGGDEEDALDLPEQSPIAGSRLSLSGAGKKGREHFSDEMPVEDDASDRS